MRLAVATEQRIHLTICNMKISFTPFVLIWHFAALAACPIFFYKLLSCNLLWRCERGSIAASAIPILLY